jgi:16S rRNA (guanine966-N2)-methyltransferase
LSRSNDGHHARTDWSILRIIAGKHRGRKLLSPPSPDTRPTSDRLRETLFNVIAPRIRDVRFLDLCAGTGAVGIEALSRDAAHATFVDRSRNMRGLIKSNLELCRVPEDKVTVVTSDALEFLRKAARRKVQAWDIVFFDPPYAGDYVSVMEALGGFVSELLAPDALLIVEHFHKNELPAEAGNLARQRVLKQGDSALSFYTRSE